jgi:hypothetical protein
MGNVIVSSIFGALRFPRREIDAKFNMRELARPGVNINILFDSTII